MTASKGALVAWLAMIVVIVQACKVSLDGTPQTALLTKKSPSTVPICLVLNDQYLYSAQVSFDVFSRVVIVGSFDEVTLTQACSQGVPPYSYWFPLGCAWEEGTYGDGIGKGAPTNFYVSVQGVSSNYRKQYAYLGDSSGTTSPNVGAVFPIVTLVISVNNGIVDQVYWDDNCYFNYVNEAGSTLSNSPMACEFNAYEIDNLYTFPNGTYQSFLNPTGTTTTGFDTFVTNAACTTNTWQDPSSPSPAPMAALPYGFCDLGIYVTWVGTSADGEQLSTANERFKRFRQYSMLSEYPTMINFNGHSLTPTTGTQAPF
jgi:hypothetical protein